MKFLCILPVCFSTLFAVEEYTLIPEGRFRFEGYEESYSLTEKQFKRFQLVHEEVVSTIEIQAGFWSSTYQLEKEREVLAIHEPYILSTGSYDNALKCFDVIDGNGYRLGYIEGVFLTQKKAQFYFYDTKMRPFAIATLKKKKAALAVCDMENNLLVACRKSFKGWRGRPLPAVKPKYLWNAYVYQSIDERFVWPFLSFIADTWWEDET